MESLGVATRPERASHAEAERVLAIEIEPGHVRAEVQGSRYDPYRVDIEIQAFTERAWREAIKALASQALFSAKLLSGEMPENIEDVFSAVGLSLFPDSPSGLKMSCSCGELVTACKHVAAIHAVLAEKLDADPFLLFRWRGFSRERILRQLRQQRAAEASGRAVDRASERTLEESIDDYWSMEDTLSAVSFSVGPPAVSASLLKRLGPPPFWKPHPEIRGSLERLYSKVTERAMALAYGGRGISESEGESRE